jgi:hypothetical protein
MAQNFTTDVTQWQGVDDEPTAGSKNLVTSGGVAYNIDDVVLPKFGIVENFQVGGILANGTESSSDEHRRTDYISVNAGDIINVVLVEASTDWNVISYYDSSKSYLSSISINQNARGLITIPNGVSFVRFSYLYSEELMIHVYSTPVSLEVFEINKEAYRKNGFEINGNVTEKYGLLPVILQGGDTIKIATNNGGCRVFLVDKTYSQRTEVTATLGNGEWNTVTIPSGTSCNCIYFYDSTASSSITYSIKMLPNCEIYLNNIEKLNKDTEELRNARYVGGILANGNEATAATEYEHSDYIEVVDGFDFKVSSTCGSSSWCCVACYYADKTYVQAKSFTWSYDGVLSVGEAIKYIRISGLSGYSLSVEYVEKKKILLNTITNIKYPKLVGNKACFAIQLDGGNTFAQHKKFLQIAREYGLMSIDFAINPRIALPNPNPANSKWFAEKQQEGCEIIYHNLIGTKSDFSEESQLTVSQLRTNLMEEIVDFRQLGYTPFGVVANEGKLADRYKGVVDDLFLWKITISTHILTNQSNETTKSSFLTDKEIHRMGFDLPTNHTSTDENNAITYGKQWIDNICNNKSMGVMYAHALDTDMIAGITENVFREMCSYLQTKISNGELIYSNTSECLNYLMM